MCSVTSRNRNNLRSIFLLFCYFRVKKKLKVNDNCIVLKYDNFIGPPTLAVKAMDCSFYLKFE